MTDSSQEKLAEFFPAESQRPAAIRAAESDASILVLGEPGTGRSSLARAFHQASRRSDRSLIEVDTGSVVSSLFESELFGYRKGAFTGAESDNDGSVRRAEGGTLVLDHVEEIPLAIQPKLLRLFSENSYAPLGGLEVSCNVRFVAIGAEDLMQRVQRGTFREDLYYRLAVLSFRIPPLRERRRELPGIIDRMLLDLGERFGVHGLDVSSSARSWMLEYDWPGNLRQLRNLLERALILGRSRNLDPPPPAGSGVGMPPSLAEVEKGHIRRVLAYTRGHQGKASRILGISRKALWEKRRRYGIP